MKKFLMKIKKFELQIDVVHTSNVVHIQINF